MFSFQRPKFVSIFFIFEFINSKKIIHGVGFLLNLNPWRWCNQNYLFSLLFRVFPFATPCGFKVIVYFFYFGLKMYWGCISNCVGYYLGCFISFFKVGNKSQLGVVLGQDWGEYMRFDLGYYCDIIGIVLLSFWVRA
jgi:hypothetical protein